MTIVETSRPITGGVDTRLDVHLAVALDGIGGMLAVEELKAAAAGDKAPSAWLRGLGGRRP